MARNGFRLIGRREAVSMIGASAWAIQRAVAAPEQAAHFTSLDHVEFFATDVVKSTAFYARIFGATVLKNNRTQRRYIKLGSAYIAIDQGQEIHVDHFCAGSEGFQIATLHSYLDQRGIPYKDYPSGRDLYVADPDGTRLQLAAENGWTQLLTGTASPESIAISGEPIFQPTGLDHILLNVSDPEKAAAHYEKVLGPVTQRNNNRIWFQAGKSRIGLLKTPSGGRAGVNHFCVSAAAFNYDAVMKKLEQADAKLEPVEAGGSPEFRDLDGYLVQVTGPPAAAKK
jgi:catechol 2,3-dioxygenase-like lactoylglutathione lyase family enzyme